MLFSKYCKLLLLNLYLYFVLCIIFKQNSIKTLNFFTDIFFINQVQIWRPKKMSQNPYEKIYDALNISISQSTTYEEAQQIAIHLGYIYNTFGAIVKDFISIIGHKFKSQTSQTFSNSLKKDKKLADEVARADRKNKERHGKDSNQQQLEGNFKTTPPNRLIMQIQNYKKPGNKNLPGNQQTIKSKLLKLNESLKDSSLKQDKQTDFTNENQSTQKQPDFMARRIPMKKKKDTVVIDISSQDEQKMQQDSQQSNRRKTRSQLRTHQNKGNTCRHQTETKIKKRGRGRPSIRNNEKSSSKRSGSNDYKQSAKRPHPLDPFAIIYNVPYQSLNKKSQQSQIYSMSQSKKHQKLQKRRQKSSIGYQQYSREKQAQKDSENQGQVKIPQQYKSNSFIKKVVLSYENQKNKIKERIQNLQRQYQSEVLHNQYQKNSREDNKYQSSQQNNQDQQQNQSNKDSNEDDAYEYEYEQNQHQNNQNSQEESQQQISKNSHQKNNFDNEICYDQRDYGRQLRNQDYQDKLQNREYSHGDAKENYLNQINQQIQKQFEENLRMNQQFDQDQYDQNIDSENHFQNQVSQNQLNYPSYLNNTSELNNPSQLNNLIEQNNARQLNNEHAIQMENSFPQQKNVEDKDDLGMSDYNKSFDSYQKVVFDNFAQNQVEQNILAQFNKQGNDQNQSNIQCNNQQNRRISSFKQKQMLNQEEQIAYAQHIGSLSKHGDFQDGQLQKNRNQEILRVLQSFESSQNQQFDHQNGKEKQNNSKRDHNHKFIPTSNGFNENSQLKQNQSHSISQESSAKSIYSQNITQKNIIQNGVNKKNIFGVSNRFSQINKNENQGQQPHESHSQQNDVINPPLQEHQNGLFSALKHSQINLYTKKSKKIEVIQLQQD